MRLTKRQFRVRLSKFLGRHDLQTLLVKYPEEYAPAVQLAKQLRAKGLNLLGSDLETWNCAMTVIHSILGRVAAGYILSRLQELSFARRVFTSERVG